MSIIKTVAVVGASGNLGQPVVRELLDAGFKVTALARGSSTADYPSGVEVKKVDYSSVDSLKEALKGQDALVSTVATVAIGSQTTLVDAAVAAGVKRFIPSEFGINTRKLAIPGLKKILSGKVKTADYLQQKADQDSDFTWTGIATGMFFDWGLAKGTLGLDLKTKTATVVDSGNERFQASNLTFIGKVVASILKKPSETANKYLLVGSFNPTQNEVIAIAEELTGSSWTINHASSTELGKLGDEKLEKGDFSAFRELLQVHLYSDGSGNGLKYEESDNGLLDLQKEDLKDSIRNWLLEGGAI